MADTVMAVYDTVSAAQQAKDALLTRGFAPADVRITTRDEEGATDAGANASVGDKIVHFFSNLFGAGEPRADADYYTGVVRQGGAAITVAVANDEEADRAQAVLEQHHPVDINTRQEGRSGLSGAGDTTPVSEASGQARIPVVEEQLKVGKREVGRGGVRVISRVVETPVEEHVHLREEQAKVERQPADRPATDADLAALRDTVVEVQARGEEAVVEKSARVIEEVVVGKTVSERTETVNDTVRRTDVRVEDAPAPTTAPPAPAVADPEADFRAHAQTAYAGHTYEDYAPAYRYGVELSRDPRYAQRDWDALEADVRREWEAQHPESAWDQAKEAIRYGWSAARYAASAKSSDLEDSAAAAAGPTI